MTADEALALGRRAVACKAWRWTAGTLDNYGRRVMAASRYTVTWDRYLDVPDRPDLPTSAWPDLRDPATLGCLLALVREAWRDPHVFVRYHPAFDNYEVIVPSLPRHIGYADTEAEILVDALEAAP